jgi:hypothetical protein
VKGRITPRVLTLCFQKFICQAALGRDKILGNPRPVMLIENEFARQLSVETFVSARSTLCDAFVLRLEGREIRSDFRFLPLPHP